MNMGEHPKSPLTAWERWELASFDSATRPPAGSAIKAEAPAFSNEEIVRIREQAREEARQAGHAAGHAEGLASGKAQAEALGRAEALRLAQVIDKLERSIAQLDQLVADDLLALSIEVARQVIRQAVEVKPEVVLGVIREALQQLPLLHAAIHLHPEDAALARLRAGDQLAHGGHRIHEDPQLKRGDVVIEAGGSHLDASLATRWRRVIEALGQHASWIDTVDSRAAAGGPGNGGVRRGGEPA